MKELRKKWTKDMVEPSYCEGNQSEDSSHHSLQTPQLVWLMEGIDLVSVDQKDL